MSNTRPRSTLLTLKLPEALARRLAQVAERRGISKSEAAREALARFVAEPEPKPYAPSALALAGDLVGVVHGAPADLSTERDYLEDFGRH